MFKKSILFFLTRKDEIILQKPEISQLQKTITNTANTKNITDTLITAILQCEEISYFFKQKECFFLKKKANIVKIY